MFQILLKLVYIIKCVKGYKHVSAPDMGDCVERGAIILSTVQHIYFGKILYLYLYLYYIQLKMIYNDQI